MEHDSENLVPPQRVAILPPVLSADLDDEEGDAEPEEGEEAVKGRRRCQGVLPVKGGEVAAEDQVGEFAPSC